MVNITKNRFEPLLPYIKGEDILDIGCVGMGTNDIYGGFDFMHGELVKTHKNVIGLDINQEGVDKMNKLGFNLICQDAQEPYDLKQKFDTIITEENIEHISNLKTYLDNIKHHLKENGRLILTTPNAMCMDFILQTIFAGKPIVNQYHTHYHTEDTIKYLLRSNGFKVEKMFYIHAISPYMNWRARVWKHILRWLPERFGRNIVIVAMEDKDERQNENND